jgi:hypothetical protein
MKLKKKTKQVLNNSTFQRWCDLFLASFLSAQLGVLATVFFESNIKTIIIVLSIILVFGIVLAILVYKESVTFDLVKILKQDQSKNHWKEIIRIAYPLSRALWLARHYKLKIELGKLTVKACEVLMSRKEADICINDNLIPIVSIYSRTLIDDLGWTLYKLNSNNYLTAKENINKGINSTNDYSIIIKGYRHLSGMESELDHPYDSVQSHENKIIEIIESIDYKEKTKPQKQKSDFAMINYAFARNKIRYIRLGQLAGTIKTTEIDRVYNHISIAESYYKENDPDRFAKIYAVKSEAYMLENIDSKLNDAESLLKEGRAYCKNEVRKDNYIRISILLLKNALQRLKINEYKDIEIKAIKDEAKLIANEILIEIKNSDDEDTHTKHVNVLIQKIKKH